MIRFQVVLFYILFIAAILFAQQPQLHIFGEPELSPSEIVAVRDDKTGQFCAAISVISDLVGFGYSSESGVVQVDFSRPGKDLVFLLPSERILEIYHADFQPLRIILSEIGIQLQAKQVWIIKLTGDKKITDGFPILIETNTDSVDMTIDGEKRGWGDRLIFCSRACALERFDAQARLPLSRSSRLI